MKYKIGQDLKQATTARALFEVIERDVRQGTLVQGDRLPTVRDLANEIGVNKNTVAAGYRMLRSAGLIRADRRLGTVVAPQPAVIRPVQIPVPDGMVNLTDGNPDPALLPPVDRALSALTGPPRLYGGAKNLAPLVAWAREAFVRDGIPADDVAVTGGAMDGIERALNVSVRPGDRVIVEDPGYPGVLNLIRGLGLVPVPAAVDAFGLVPASLAHALERRVQACIFTSRAQNPMGGAFDASRAQDLRRIIDAAPDDILFIDDDHVGAVSGAPVEPIHVRPNGNWIIVRSVSKLLGPDYRLAFLTGDPVTVGRLQRKQSLGMRWQSHLIQKLVHALLTDDTVGAAIEQAQQVYTQRRDAVHQALAARGIASLGRSGLNIWIPVENETATVQWLAHAGWAVRGGADFRTRSGPGIRVTTARVTPDQAIGFAVELKRFLSAASETFLS